MITISWLTLFQEIIVIYYENDTKPIENHFVGKMQCLRMLSRRKMSESTALQKTRRQRCDVRKTRHTQTKDLRRNCDALTRRSTVDRAEIPSLSQSCCNDARRVVFVIVSSALCLLFRRQFVLNQTHPHTVTDYIYSVQC